MYLVSAGETTVLSDFADLETISTYKHKNAETTDFQFYNNSEIFLEVNKKAGLEVMRIKEIQGLGGEIQLVRKLKIENAYCVACARQSLDEMAIGLSNGQVKIYNYRKTETLQKFFGDKFNSVVCLDYNASDDYIAAVQENGIINVFGKKTGAKIESINIDSNSTLARFHPTQRFQLAIASYKGAVTTYNVSDKRKIFHAPDSHNAPCRDLCISLASPSTILSVGYDCVINIFDTRRKGHPVQLKHNHPLSSVALSDCGTFFCVGSLKGELITYDMRSTKKPLGMKKVYDCPVNRVAFVPQIINVHQPDNASNSLVSRNSTSVGVDQRIMEGRKSFASSRSQRDSFCDFLNIRSNLTIEKTSSRLTRTTTNRDSFDWEALTHKNRSLFHMRSSLSTENNSGGDVREVFKISESFEKKSHTADSNVQEIDCAVQPNAPLREINRQSSQKISLNKIQEEKLSPQTTEENSLNSSSGSDKENPQIHLELHKQMKSTPNSNAPAVDQHLPEQLCSPPNDCEKIQKLLDEQRASIEARLHQLEYNLKLEGERNKWAVFTQSFNLWQQVLNNTEEIRNALAVLLQTDPFVVEFTRLTEENKVLKSQLEHLSRKK